MAKIGINEYLLNNPKLLTNRDIISMSDIHGNIVALKYVIKLLEKLKADYVFISGDTLDDIDDSSKEELLVLLKIINQISKTYISLGNHDIVKTITDKLGRKNNIATDEYIDYFNEIKRVTNCQPLIKTFQNVILDTDLSLSALNMPYSFYENEDSSEFDKILSSVPVNIDKSKFNLSLLHTPNSIIKNDEILVNNDIINDMNLILCGHNHGGLVPTFIQDIKKGHTGFVGPNARLIQHNAYGVYSKNDISLLISNGITKISKSSSLRNFSEILSTIYIPEIELIHMKKSDKHSLQLINRHIYKF